MMLARRFQGLGCTVRRLPHARVVLELRLYSRASCVLVLIVHRARPLVFLLSEVEDDLGLLQPELKFVHLLDKILLLLCMASVLELELLDLAFEFDALLH